LQHFIDRKVAALFEPLIALQKDEALTGLARGFAFRMVENFGIIERASVAEEVKSLDQDARGALRKHGIRFGQYTVFQPAILKPAPTRLRLVLWALAKGLEEFPEAAPPGLVTVPVLPGMPEGYFTMAGYRVAGERAIRIDMLERLADQLRAEDSRAGFEAKADMLSITGMTLEQFALLMEGLGYRAEKGERAKVKAAPATPAEVEAAPEAAPEVTEAVEAPAAEAAEEAAPEMETFFTFTWGRKPQGERPNRGQGRGQPRDGARREGGENREARGDRPKREGGDRPKGDRGDKFKGGKGGKGGKPRPEREDRGPKVHSARPPREEKFDPDSPFAALMALKQKG
ncbi:MAG: disulfide oxidoreductase, partial [Rhodobacteraceae bacterium]|nr:disulfide oxidoreductase [Paracoccaceae bacterium]